MKNKLDIIFDECLERILVRGETLEDCLRDHPEHAGELRDLLTCALSARETVEAVEPRPEFRAQTKQGLLMAVREARYRKSRGFHVFWRPAWTAVAASFFAVILASTFTVGAAGNAMPDEPLYPIKVVAERARLTLTLSPVAKAQLSAELADKRVGEIVHLANKGKVEEIDTVTERLNRSLERVVEFSGGEKKVARAPSPAPKPVPAPKPSPAPAPRPAAAPQGSPAPPVKDKAVAGALASPPPATPTPSVAPKPAPPPEKKPPAVTPQKAKKTTDKQKIKETVTKNAAKNQAELREALKKAPESAKPAIRRALANAEKAYQKARESLEDDDDD